MAAKTAQTFEAKPDPEVEKLAELRKKAAEAFVTFERLAATYYGRGGERTITHPRRVLALEAIADYIVAKVKAELRDARPTE